MADLRKHSSTSNLMRFSLKHSTTGQGLTGLTEASSGLIIGTIADNEATTTRYRAGSSEIETISTLGTFAAPTSGKCRFKEVDATNHPGLYEFQFADARFSVASAKRLVISVTGASNLLTADYEIQLVQIDHYDSVRFGMTALPNAAAEASGGLITRGTSTGQLSVSSGQVILQSGTGTGQLDFTSGVVKANVTQYGGSNGTFSSGRPEVNTTHIAGSAVSTTSAQIGVNVVQVSGDATAADNLEKEYDGTGYGPVLVSTTIASLSSQTSFTLTAGSADNDAYNGCVIVIEDASTAAQKAVGVVLDYTGSSKTVTLLNDPAVFTMATTDLVTILADRAVKPTVDNRTLDVTATGGAGIDWNNVENPTTTLNLSGTTVKTATDVETDTADIQSRIGTPSNLGGGASLAANLADIEAQTDDIGTAGAGLTAIPWNASWDAEVQSEVDDALVAQRLDELLNADSDIDGAQPPTVGSVYHELLTKTAGSFTYDQTTDSLEAIRDRGDAAWTTGSGTSTLTQADVRTAVGLASANLDTQLSGIQSDTDNIQTRLPAALVSGRMDSNTQAMADGVITDAKFTTPSESAGIPTTVLAMLRRVYERQTRKRTRDRDTGTYTLRNAADSGNLETNTQSTAGNVDSITASS